MTRSLVFLTLSLSCGAAAQTLPPARHVVLISVDGMRAAEYLPPAGKPVTTPTIHAMAEAGCASAGAKPVFPSVTFPNHASMVTGQPPAVHGILSNTLLDPLNLTNAGWYFFAEDIKVPTIWQAVKAAGGTTAAVTWPVSVGGAIDYLVPEYRATQTGNDAHLLRSLSTPGLLREIEAAYGTMPHPLTDAWRFSAATYILTRYKPTLLLFHIEDTDHAQHSYGPDSPEAGAAFATVDAQIATLKKTAEAALGKENISWVIVSDHGFQAVSQQLNPRIALRKLGYLTYDAHDKLTAWRIFPWVAGGMFALVANDPADREAIEATTKYFTSLAKDPRNGIAHVYDRDALAKADSFPNAFLAIDMVAGFTVGEKSDGELVAPSSSRGTHGFSPDNPAMNASFVLSGAGTRACGAMSPASLMDVAPTVAALLHLNFSGSRGHSHPEALGK